MSRVATRPTAERLWPDAVSSTDTYAKRFAGSVGTYFLKVQKDEVIQRVVDCEAESVLDVGGGHCQLAKAFAKRGIAVTVTGSTSRCEDRLRAELRDDEYSFVKSGLFPLPLEDGSFDVVASFRTMSHLPDWPCMLAELCRVSRSAVIVDFAVKSWASRFSGTLLSAKQIVEPDTRPYLAQSITEVGSAFASNGFQVEHVYRQFAIPMAVHRVLRMQPVSSVAEDLSRFMGITKWIGSPVIVTAVRGELG